MRELLANIAQIVIASAFMLGSFITAGVLLYLAFAALRNTIRRFTAKHGRAAAAALAILSAAMFIYGGGKPTDPSRISITWDAGLYDAGSRADTNEPRRVTALWTYANWIPPSATVTLLATPLSSPTNLLQAVGGPVAVGAGVIEVEMPTDATNYLYYGECSYVPTPAVVTNGVYHIPCTDVGRTNVWVPVGLKIYEWKEPDAEPRVVSPASNHEE